jgi:hypothetical protein
MSTTDRRWWGVCATLTATVLLMPLASVVWSQSLDLESVPKGEQLWAVFADFLGQEDRAQRLDGFAGQRLQERYRAERGRFVRQNPPLAARGTGRIRKHERAAYSASSAVFRS